MQARVAVVARVYTGGVWSVYGWRVYTWRVYSIVWSVSRTYTSTKYEVRCSLVIWPKVKCILVIWPVLQVTIPHYEQIRHFE